MKFLMFFVFLSGCASFVQSQEGTISGDPNHPCYFNPCGIYGKCSVSNGLANCTCESGYVYDGTICRRPHPCDPSPCDEQATCRVIGRRVMCTCIYGFTGNGRECSAIDPCQTHDCHADANCIRSADNFTYTCECADGYSGDGKTCDKIPVVVVDPCQNNSCPETARCIAVLEDNSYFCRCNPGYTGSGDTCTRIVTNACQNRDCHVNANCMPDKTQQTFKCACQEGYIGDGRKCQKISRPRPGPNPFPRPLPTLLPRPNQRPRPNPIPQPNPCINHRCGENAICIPAADGQSYYCRCKDNFRRIGGACRPIDPCASSPCHQFATCTAENFIARCTCRNDIGFYGNGLICHPSPECQHCHQYANCVYSQIQNTFDLFGRFFLPQYRYQCICRPGYVGNGIHCNLESSGGSNQGNNFENNQDGGFGGQDKGFW